MDRRDYAILGGLAIGIVSWGLITTSQPFVPYLQDALREWFSVTVSMV